MDPALEHLLAPGGKSTEEPHQMAFMVHALPHPAPLNLGDATPGFAIYEELKSHVKEWGTPVTREYDLTDQSFTDEGGNQQPCKALVTGRGLVIIWRGGRNVSEG